MDLAGAALFGPCVREALGDPTLTVEVFRETDPTFVNGVVAVIMALDPETAEITVERPPGTRHDPDACSQRSSLYVTVL